MPFFSFLAVRERGIVFLLIFFSLFSFFFIFYVFSLSCRIIDDYEGRLAKDRDDRQKSLLCMQEEGRVGRSWVDVSTENWKRNVSFRM